VGSSYNFAANIYHPILEAYKQRDLETANLWQDRSIQTIDIIAAHGYLPAAKAVMKMLGVECGPARPPLGNLTEVAKTSLKNGLEKIGFFDWVS
jgi:N-acetylneuraminate lyase